MPNEVIEKYRDREISAVDVSVYACLCSLRREYDGVRVSQRRVASFARLTEKTVSASVERLYNCGLVLNVITDVVKRRKKYQTSIYHLKPLPSSGFFFVPRHVFNFSLSPKMFAIYAFLCKSNSFDYHGEPKSWNSYNDICDKLGFKRCQRSEVVKLIGGLAALGLIKKTVRRIKKAFVDNIYRVVGFAQIVLAAAVKRFKSKRKTPPHSSGTLFSYKLNHKHRPPHLHPSVVIIPYEKPKVNTFEQIFFEFENIFLSEGG
jgi:predicted transcriptional regulator